MNKESVYSFVQDLFRRGVVTIVGSGASAAYGLPTMGQLSDHLLSNLAPSDMDTAAEAMWAEIADRLRNGEGLELALGSEPLPDDLANLITYEVAKCVGQEESTAIQGLVTNPEIPTFGRLFAHLLQNNVVADVITTNYDRLLEVAAARTRIRMDTMFFGHTIGRLDEQLSREELLEPKRRVGRPSAIMLTPRPHVRLSKPHGSMDWFELNGEYIRTEIAGAGNRRIVAPGGNKYRLGYDLPYDQQRARANRAIDEASAFLSIGYGFNDDHLQTHLAARFPKVPALVLARTLSPNTLSYLESNSRAIGIEARPGGANVVSSAEQFALDEPIWELDVLLREVLGK